MATLNSYVSRYDQLFFVEKEEKHQKTRMQNTLHNFKTYKHDLIWV